MKKVLITGSNGFIGQKLLASFSGLKEFQPVAVSRGEDKAAFQWQIPFERMDITDPAQVDECFQKYRPDTVIHSAAISQTDRCEKNPEECRKINVNGTENVLRACERVNAHFIFLSTDFVFDGTSGPYREDDSPHPLSVYGKSKWTSEQMIMQSKTAWAVARTILVYGTLPVMPGPNIISFVKNNLEKGQGIKVVCDQFRMPTLAEDLAAGILEIARRKAEGIFHLSGSELVSIYEFAKLTARTFGLNEDLITPVFTESLNETAKRPKRTGFILDKARRVLNYRPHSLSDGLNAVKKQFSL